MTNKTNKTRQKRWEEQCHEIEELDKKGRIDHLYRKVKNITKNEQRKIQKTSIHDKNGTALKNQQKYVVDRKST